MKVKAIKKGTWPANRERVIGEAFDYDGPTSKTVKGKKVAYFPSWMQKHEAGKPGNNDPEEEDADKAAADKAEKTGE
jgi:hypothetical protein